MSEEPSDPVEAARSSVEAVNRRDFDAVEGLYAEDAILAATDFGRFEGAAAIRSFYEDLTAPYGDLRGEIGEVVDLGNGIGFFVVIGVGRPVGSTGEVRFRYATVAVVDHGVIVRQTNYIDVDEARAAAERLAAEAA